MTSGQYERRSPHDGERSVGLTRRSPRPGFLALLALAGVGLGVALLPTRLAAQPQPTPGYLIELGEAVILPGEDTALLPVFLTCEVPLSSWQMGLDYDDLLLTLVGVEFAGTLSEPLSPTVTWGPIGAPATSFAVTYPAATPFPAGTHLLAAWLSFEIAGGAQLPPGGSIDIEIAVVDADPYPVSFSDPLGGTFIPGTSHGTVAIFTYPLLAVGFVEADYFAPQGTIGVPVRAWTDGPSTTLDMGLDYDDLLMCTFDLAGGAIAAAVGGDVLTDLDPTADGIHVRLQATNGAIFPAFDGEVIGHLVMILGPTPFAGEFPIALVPGDCSIDGVPVTNLIDGGLTLADHFIRGDANFDGAIQISDAQSILGRVLLGHSIVCDDSADANDDGNLDISDPVYLLNHMFSSGPAPHAPFPEPGIDPTADSHGCL